MITKGGVRISRFLVLCLFKILYLLLSEHVRPRTTLPLRGKETKSYSVLISFQPFQVIATDMGKNSRTSSQPANVRIKVQRNEQAPVFQNEESYVKNINRNQNTNAEIVTVRATDEDTTVLFSWTEKKFKKFDNFYVIESS